ncbi:MAG: hypothetical protein OEY23_03595 [Acidimicrobiia bacterium]|nr:hypothetical protein [Acidimicrobiia bacterium]
MASIEKIVDKAYEGMDFAELAKAPVAALQGISDEKAAQLEAALGVKTIGDLAKNKYIRWAQAINDLA